MDKKKRKNTRNKVWPETEVHLKFHDMMSLKANSIRNIKAGVDNLGASGMFIITDEIIPTGTNLEITIDFQPGAKPANKLHATGVVVRTEEKKGVAVKFTRIDTQTLGDCIMARLNNKLRK